MGKRILVKSVCKRAKLFQESRNNFQDEDRPTKVRTADIVNSDVFILADSVVTIGDITAQLGNSFDLPPPLISTCFPPPKKRTAALNKVFK